MANPSFSVDRVDNDRLKDAPRLPFGLPRTDNANSVPLVIVKGDIIALQRQLLKKMLTPGGM
jgi:hypothetical protein